MRKQVLVALLIGLFVWLPIVSAQDKPFAFVAIGDTGCGCSGQEKVAERLIEWHRNKPFQLS